MKTLLLSLASIIVLVFSLTSCVPLDDPYFAGGGGGYDSGPSYSQRSYSSYGNSSSRYYGDNDDYGYGNSYGGSRYNNRPHGYVSSGYGYSSSHSSLCPICHHSPCSCSHSHNDTHYYSSGHSEPQTHSHSSSNDHDSDDKKYRYSGRVSGSASKPEGNHSREWYKDHGYPLKNLRPAN
jgi:hypothetical protein